ncbi:hypothetical protein WOLCODRAFT_159938 [Wolfiporia cocos MD-104 SS10]|uniref:Uncharacterized protein n=1 Tax=Wolfiporia cocos (strain MD-104) TaxID=742152 RepID=A0A2H3IUZ0_WOLCO|nr:hypothetical protein WOLCODRAFT_159938 [Wolfiporia cocos MD-104 SS10]
MTSREQPVDPAATLEAQLDSASAQPPLSTNRASGESRGTIEINTTPSTVLESLINSQVNLLRASAALQTTHALLRALSDTRRRMPPPDSPTPRPASQVAPTLSMGPGHDAIVLSESAPERSSDVTGTDTIPMLDRWRPLRIQRRGGDTASGDPRLQRERDRVNQVFEDLRQARRRIEESFIVLYGEDDAHTGSSGSPRPTRPSSTSSLRFGPRPEPSQTQERRPWETYLRLRRAAQNDDSSTTLGRRVAARAAGGSSSGSADMRHPTPPTTAQRIMEIANDLQRDIASIAQQNAEVNRLVLRARASSVPPGSDPDAGHPPHTSSSGNTSSRNRTARLLPDPSQPAGYHESRRSRLRDDYLFNSELSLSQRDATAQTTPLPYTPFMRSQVRSTSVRHSHNGPPEESSISGRSLDAARHRVLQFLFEEGEQPPTSNTSDVEDDDPYSWFMASPMRRNETSDNRRSAVRQARERTSLMPSSLNYTDPLIAFEERRRMARESHRYAGQTTTTSATGNFSTRSRRGWARLDQDGDEIPTDEEEEYERNRAQMRARAIQLTSRSASLRLDFTQPEPVALEPPPTHQRLSFMPTTQTPLWPSTDSDVRVRISPLRGRGAGSSSDSSRPVTPRDEDSEDERRAELSPSLPSIGSAVPFTPSPLPLPRVDLSHNKRPAAKAKVIIYPAPVPGSAFYIAR